MKRLDSYDNTTAGSSPADYGLVENETSPGAQDGTPIDAALINDTAYAIYSVLAEAGITPSGSVENTAASDFLDALRTLCDTEYVPLTVPITTFGDVSISTLSGTGLNPTQVRALCVGYYVTSNDDTSYITATWPDGTTKTIVRLRDTDSEGGPTTYLTGEIEIPVNADTTSVTFTASGGNGDKTITVHGVIQRKFKA